MKRFLSLLLFCPLFVLGQKKLSVTGKIDGLKDGSPVALIGITTTMDTLAKATVTNGAFSFKAALKEPTLATLNLSNGQRIAFFFENSIVKISGNASDPQSVKATGSPTNVTFNAFEKEFYPLFEQLGKLNERSQRFGLTDSLQLAMESAKKNIQNKIDVFIRKYKSSPVSSFLLLNTSQLTDDITLTEKRYNSLTKSATNNFYGNYLKDAIAETKVLAIGSPAIDFTQNDTLDVPVSLSSFRGKYVLLDFWASWCGPCRAENPNVVNTYNKFKAKNFTVLGVSLDRPGDKEKWLRAIHADHLTWTHVSDLNFWSNAVAIQYKIQSIPQNFLIGPDGKIVAKNLRGPALESKLCELLGCN